MKAEILRLGTGTYHRTRRGGGSKGGSVMGFLTPLCNKKKSK